MLGHGKHEVPPHRHYVDKEHLHSRGLVSALTSCFSSAEAGGEVPPRGHYVDKEHLHTLSHTGRLTHAHTHTRMPHENVNPADCCACSRPPAYACTPPAYALSTLMRVRMRIRACRAFLSPSPCSAHTHADAHTCPLHAYVAAKGPAKGESKFQPSRWRE